MTDRTSPAAQRRIAQEQRTVGKMIALYCHAQHHTQGSLCPECAELSAYAHARIARCPFLPDKPTCAKCPVHCYQPVMRAQIRQVMRYAGPRMLLHDPVAAVQHLAQMLRKPSPAVQRALARKAAKD